jgi:hypothetical protein
VSDYPIVDLSTDALPTTTRSVRKRLDLTKPLNEPLVRNPYICKRCRLEAKVTAVDAAG